ncbi:hypothetical protein GCM10029964_105160 [Kibdelosporangium lantanae]
MLAGLAGAITAFLNVSVDIHVVAPDEAMEQVIRPNDQLSVQNVPEVHRGDVVVVRSRAWARQGESVERVIGVGGDVITAADGRLVVNDRPVAEEYVYRDGTRDRFETFTVTVPQGTVFVAGDWRANSADSRSHVREPARGGVPTTDIVGVVTTVNGTVLTPTKAFTNAGLSGPAGAGEPVMWPPIVAAVGVAGFIGGAVWLVLLLGRRQKTTVLG